MSKFVNKYIAYFLMMGYYFVDDEDVECLKFHLNKCLKQIEEGDFESDFEYYFTKDEVKFYREKIAMLTSIG